MSWVMRHLGIKTKGFYFIPLVGGAAISNEAFRSGKDEIFIALMGPTFGILTVLPAVILYGITGYPIWAAAATWLAVVNLFNLFPVNPLDGGRVVKSLAFALDNKLGWILLTAGFAFSLAMSWVLGLWFLVFITIMGMLEIRPFAKWCVLVPLSLAFNIVATPFVFVFGGDVNRWWVAWYKGFVEPDRKPVMDSPFAKNSDHWVLTRQQMLMFVGWYSGMIVLFVALIMIFSGVPGADVGKMFLES
jgi:Zn-dependent protease